MQDSEFLAFLNANSANKGIASINMQTQHVSTQAVKILKASQYGMLAKQHLNANVAQAYANNKQFANKFNDVMQELNITVIA